MSYKAAQRNFILSVAGYTVASYILQVKDRHNGNIMLDEAGHIIHINFGIIFLTSRGGDLRFKKASFKYTQEMVEVMNGPGFGLKNCAFRDFSRSEIIARIS